MLMHIPKIFTPAFLKLMMEMGHGEELLICDANYPYKTQQKETVFLPGCDVADVLEQVLRFFPLDQTVDHAAVCMESARENSNFSRYCSLVEGAAAPSTIETVPRFDFYDRARAAAGIAVTTDTARGGNILLKKGVVNGECPGN